MLFSIIVPTFNRASFIGKAIDSVIAQTYKHWELIVIDDASTDYTQEVLKSYTDERIHMYVNEKNSERSASRNKGIALAKGEYICFLDSDDYFLPHHLELLSSLIKNAQQKVALFHTGVQQYNSSENTLKIIYRIQGINPVETVIACHIPVISVAVHHSIFSQFKFDSTMSINEDVYLFAQIASLYPLVYIPESSVVWVLHGNNTIDQEYDYLTPQLLATNKITQDKTIVPYLSKIFITEKYFGLYTELVYFNATKRKYTKAFLFFIKGIITSPKNKQNWTNFLNIIYHLPFGQGIKKIVSTLRK